jgi:hypothetical protein
LCCVRREAGTETDDLDTVVQDLLTGQCKGPDRIAAFNTVDRYEGRHRDIQLPPPMRLV